MRTRRSPLWLLLLLPLALLAGVWAFVLGTHARYAQWMRAHDLPLPSRGPLTWAAVWAREVKAVLWILFWQLRLPFAHRPWSPPDAHGHPVLCVHGFMQNGTNFLPIRRALYRRGRATASVTLGVPPREFASYATVLERRLRALLLQTGADKVDIVAHSMGGLVLRGMLQRAPDLRHRIGRVVTLATPHRGTGAARGAVLSLPETRIMHVRADWLDRTPRLVDLLPGHPVTAIGSLDDATVYPIDSSLGDGDRQVCLEGLGHSGVLSAPEAVAHVVASLERPMPARGAP